VGLSPSSEPRGIFIRPAATKGLKGVAPESAAPAGKNGRTEGAAGARGKLGVGYNARRGTLEKWGRSSAIPGDGKSETRSRGRPVAGHQGGLAGTGLRGGR